MAYTPTGDIKGIVDECRETYLTGRTLPLEYREEQLKALYRMVQENAEDLISSICCHYQGRSRHEVNLCDIEMTLSEIANQMNNLYTNAAPKRKNGGMAFIADTLEVRPHPYGMCLIISPWNFPLALALSPLASAIAAGNTAVIKPSDILSKPSQLLRELIPKYLDPQCYKVILGGVEETTELLKQKFDLIMFTGNTHVGRIVSIAAAKHLTPVILELGGKNPVILHESTDIETAARRIACGRVGLNAGQVCIAPEYIMMEPKHKDKFMTEYKKAVDSFYNGDPMNCTDFGPIVNDSHFKRLGKLLDENRQYIIMGGKTNPITRKIEPTVMLNPPDDSSIMQGEVFGPILTIKTIEDLTSDKAVKYVNDRAKPLALYVFSEDQQFSDSIINRTCSGGVCVNDTIMQFCTSALPFGGVGESGSSMYHGEYGFQAFSHQKAVMLKNPGLEFVNSLARYPPLTDRKIKIFKSVAVETPHSFFSMYLKHIALLASVGGAARFIYSKL